MLLKYEILEPNAESECSLVFKEKTKILVRCFLLVTLVTFLFLCYAPVHFQLTQEKSPSDSLVDGWGLNTSRFIPLYIIPNNDTALILNNNLCSEPIPLVIIVCSAVDNWQTRLVIRESWGNYSSRDYKLAFLLGVTENSTLQESVEEEARTYNDVIQENFIDSYNNLTLKSIMLLKYIKYHCDKVEYILKSDDDMFIHIENLLLLIKELMLKKIKNVLLGELICNAKPIHDSASKWYSPKYMFHEDVYPHYLSGTGYLMDRKVALSLYEAALRTPFFHLEDVYITGLCARKVNIIPRHHNGFSYKTRPLDPCLYIKNKNVITSHRVTPDNMKQLWAGLQNGTYCIDETATSTPELIKGNKLLSFKKNRCS